MQTWGNLLVLFTLIEKQGKKYYETLCEIRERSEIKRDIFYIDGKVKVSTRTEIKENVEDGDNIITLASYGTSGEGWSVDRFHALHCVSGYKVDGKTNQAIGRALRLGHDKKEARINDYIPVCIYDGQENYLFSHGKNRILNYINEEFDYGYRNIKVSTD